MNSEERLHLGAAAYDEGSEQYREHYLDQYRTYLEMADRISSRRQQANEYFLAINSALVALAGLAQTVMERDAHLFYGALGVSGLVLCYTWYRLVRSYKGLNSGKFEIIHLMEKRLPLSPYSIEWEVLGGGKDPAKYLPFTVIEMRVPWIFFGLHLVLLVYVLVGA